jgi:hypothetical protein
MIIMIILIEAVNTHEMFDDDRTNGSLEWNAGNG